MSKSYTITKELVESYKIRMKNGAYADITVDSKDNTGRLQVSSDYGSWDYYWGACGQEFKKFIISLNKDYVAGKFGCGSYFYAQGTIEAMKGYIIDDPVIDENFAKELLDELKELKDAPDDQNEFYNLISERCPKVMEHFDHQIYPHTDTSPSFNRFWDELWPIFIDELKSEMVPVGYRRALVREVEPYDEKTDMRVHEEVLPIAGTFGVATDKMQILESAAGFYIGNLYKDEDCGGIWLPNMRDSQDYWPTLEEAETAFKQGDYKIKF